MYSTECPGEGNVPVDLPGTGCDAGGSHPQIQYSRSESPTHKTLFYIITIVTDQDQTMKALLSFSQPVDETMVDVSGSVSQVVTDFIRKNYLCPIPLKSIFH